MRPYMPLILCAALGAGCAVDPEDRGFEPHPFDESPGLAPNDGRFLLPSPIPLDRDVIASILAAPTISELGVMEERPGFVGHRETRVPIPTDAECLPAPGPAALRVGGALGISFRVASGVTGANLRRVELVRLGPGARRTVLSRSFPAATRSASEYFVPLATEAEVSADVTALPRLRYELTVEDEAGRITRSTLERKLAPVPEVVIEAPAFVTGPSTGAGSRVSSAGYRVRNAEILDLVGVRSSDRGSPIEFGIVETEATIRDHGAPAVSMRVTPSPTMVSGRMCDAQFLSSTAWNEWKRARLPLRLYARAPSIEGCAPWTLSAPIEAADRTTPVPVSTDGRPPPAPSWPTCVNHGRGGGVGGGGVIGGSGTPATCTGEGTACEVTPSQCDAGVNPITVAGRIQCRGSRAECVPTAPFCPGPDPRCGAAYGQTCRRDEDCSAGLFCGRRIGGCVGHGDDVACGACQSITYRDGSICTPPPGLCWLPGTTPPGRGCMQNTCTRQCDGSTCGNDGCGGLCGTCESGQVCEPRPASPYGGTCRAR
jgi:hypothetical protein